MTAKEILEIYWHTEMWIDAEPSDDFLRQLQAEGIDPLEVLRSRHHELDWYGIPERCVPWTDV